MDRDHVGLHGLFDHVVDLVVALIVAEEMSRLLPGAGDGIAHKIPHLCVFGNSDIPSGEICEALDYRFPDIIRGNAVGEHVVDGHPALGHLIDIALRHQLLRREEFHLLPRTAQCNSPAMFWPRSKILCPLQVPISLPS